MLIEFGNPQPPTPLHTENSTPADIVNNTMKRQISQAMDMRYLWLLYQVYQCIFAVKWAPGLETFGDYHTKQFNSAYHSCM